jgi:phytoene dehydrogenase-like protein
MPAPERVAMLILGSGEGGKFLACNMAESGHRTVVVERKLIGGSARTRTAFRARTRSGARKSLIAREWPRMGTSVGQPQPLTLGYGGTGADRHRQAQAGDLPHPAG